MNTIRCPFNVLSGDKCVWTGPPSDAIGHVEGCHDAEAQEKSRPFAVKLQSCWKYKNFHKAVIMSDRLFYLLWISKEDKIYFLVFVTPKQTKEDYVYDFKLKKCQEQIAVTGGTCGNFSHHDSKGLETGDIVALERSTLQKFVDEKDDLTCVIEIRSKEATPSFSRVSDVRDMEEHEKLKMKKLKGPWMSRKFRKSIDQHPLVVV